MKRIHAILLFLATAALVIGCAKNTSNAATDTTRPVAAKESPATTQAAPTRLSMAEATVAVREELFRTTPKMNPSAEFPLKEMTTDEVWERLHLQVFAITGDIRCDQAYVVRNGQVFPLGEGLGGSGVMSMCVADLNGDGQPKLVFSYSWGSGVHRSLVAVWTGGTTWTDAKPVLSDYDFFLEKTDDNHVGVAYGYFSSKGEFKRQGEFGKLQLSGGKAGLDFKIILNQELPEEVVKCVWK